MIFQNWDPNCKPITSPGQEAPQTKGVSKARDWYWVLGCTRKKLEKQCSLDGFLCFRRDTISARLYTGSGTYAQIQSWAHPQSPTCHSAGGISIIQILDIVRNLNMASFYKIRFKFLPSQPPCCSGELQFFHQRFHSWAWSPFPWWDTTFSWGILHFSGVDLLSRESIKVREAVPYGGGWCWLSPGLCQGEFRAGRAGTGSSCRMLSWDKGRFTSTAKSQYPGWLKII